MGNKQTNQPTPADFSELGKQTEFTQEELRTLYDEFGKEYPRGKMTRDDFRRVYTRFFPNGDAEKFTEHVFRNFDANRDGTINFRELMCGLSVLMKGSVDQKLTWIFCLFDVDKSGRISKSEMIQILTAMDRMKESSPMSIGPIFGFSAETRTQRIFERADSNMDGELSFHEFFCAAKRDATMMSLLQMDKL